jgi:hypothetical protein
MSYRDNWAELAAMYQRVAAGSYSLIERFEAIGDTRKAAFYRREASRDYRVARWYLFNTLRQPLDPSAPSTFARGNPFDKDWDE